MEFIAIIDKLIDALSNSIGLALVGASFLLFAAVSLLKLAIAINRKCNTKAAFASKPPRDAFAGKTIWISGASSGYGRALALHLCSHHDDVQLILSSRRKSVLEEVATMCLAAGNGRASVKVLPLDLNDFASLPSKVEEAISLFDSPIDILVNNGGITTRSLATNATFGVDERVIRVDFLAYVLLTKCLLKSCWERQEMKTNPIIINTTSVAGKVGLPVRTAYCGAKHALHGWFDSLRMEQSIINGKPIHILNVVLGSTRTNIARNAITSNPETKFGDDTVDMNIESGLDPNFVVERVVAVAYARQDEIWIAPRKELLVLYLSQYFPEMAKKLISKKFAKQYAVQGSKEKKL